MISTLATILRIQVCVCEYLEPLGTRNSVRAEIWTPRELERISLSALSLWRRRCCVRCCYCCCLRCQRRCGRKSATHCTLRAAWTVARQVHYAGHSRQRRADARLAHNSLGASASKHNTSAPAFVNRPDSREQSPVAVATIALVRLSWLCASLTTIVHC